MSWGGGGAAVWAVSGSRAAVRDIWGLSGRGGVRQQVEGRLPLKWPPLYYQPESTVG